MKNISNVIPFIKKHWRTILELTTLLGIILAVLEYRLQQRQFLAGQQQFLYEQQQRPMLEYSYQLALSSADDQIMFQQATQLVGMYYEQLFELSQTQPLTNYIEATQTILPITATVPTQPASVIIKIENKGEMPATKVRAVIDMDRPITNISPNTKELWSIVRGEIGEKSLTIDIDRIVAKNSVFIVVESESTVSSIHQDQIILDRIDYHPFLYDTSDNLISAANTAGFTTTYTYDAKNRVVSITDPNGATTRFTYDEHDNLTSVTAPLGNKTLYTYDELNRLASITHPDGKITAYTYGSTPLTDSSTGSATTLSGPRFSFFPTLEYISAKRPSVQIMVTSNEGAAKFVNWMQ